MSNATPTRPAAPEDNAPIDRAYLRAPALPACPPLVGIPVSAASPTQWDRYQAACRATVEARLSFGPDSDEYRAAVAKAEELSAPYKPLPGNPLLDEDDGEADAEIDRLGMLGLDAWGRVK